MDDRLERLRTHCIGLCTEVIWREITHDGCILVRDGNDGVYEDGVTTHHLVDLLLTLDGHLYSGNIRRACQWFAKERSDLADPFFVTTLAQADFFGTDDKKKVSDAILRHRRNSGLIEIFAGFLDGGSLFSTLWGVKILLLLQQEQEYQDMVVAGLKAVRDRWDDLHRTSFKGFYAEMALASGDPELRSECGSICSEIIQAQGPDGLWDGSIFYSPYVASNLITCANAQINAKEALQASDRCLDQLFELEEEVKGIPQPLKDAASSSVESAYLQAIIRSVIAGVRRLRVAQHDVSSDVAVALLGTWPTLYHATGSLDARLKRMLQQYGEIEKEFHKQKEAAAQLLETSPYERNVFVMMPFRQQEDEQYEQIERIVREELEKKGFHAWLATDRELDSTLWGNITSFMTGCKYGVAVFTRRDDAAKGTIEPDFNPNVSLELGFMTSRAKRVLLLKDSVLRTLPTDLMGHLYKQFDLRKVGRQLPPLVRQWADDILASETNDTDKASDGGEPK